MFAGATLHVDAAKLGEEGAGQRLRRARPPEATRQREGSCLLSSPTSSPTSAAAGFAESFVAAVAAFELTSPRSMMGAAPLCAPAVVTGAFSIERRGKERKRSAGEEGAKADKETADDEGEGATHASLLLFGAFSTEKTVAPLGMAAPGTLQAETGWRVFVVSKERERERKEEA